jgi:hypothetical protein
LTFGDGSRGRVYRESVVDHAPDAEPAVLVVSFRLGGVRGVGHALFRAESLLNTPLFVGFPGFVSKLWLAHDEHGVYPGFAAGSCWRIPGSSVTPGPTSRRRGGDRSGSSALRRAGPARVGQLAPVERRPRGRPVRTRTTTSAAQSGTVSIAEPGARDPALAERTVEGPKVDDRAAGGVDQDGGWARTYRFATDATGRPAAPFGPEASWWATVVAG